jgi:trans-AT polyketide synthase/acyltransferase/oxidoreductase domain-containing protein
MTAFVFPGQGSQFIGMGAPLFAAYPELTRAASGILGFEVDALCAGRSALSLTDTRYTQPAIFVVSALAWLERVERTGAKPSFVLGHSLGEITALFAASAVTFEDAVRLVKRRGELMAQAPSGGMAAVLGLDLPAVERVLRDGGMTEVCVANHNADAQCVLSGSREAIAAAAEPFRAAGARSYVPLAVSGAFHSPLMKAAEEGFRRYLDDVAIAAPAIPVVSNVEARPYDPARIRETLSRQLTGRVRWVESVRYVLDRGGAHFEEIGPGAVLTKLIAEIRGSSQRTTADASGAASPPSPRPARTVDPASLGSAAFRADYGLRLAYAAGSMYRGISSKDLVVRMARGGLLAFFGAGGLAPDAIEEALLFLKRSLPGGETFGMNLLCNPGDPAREEATVDLYLRHGVTLVEASAYIRASPALVRYRVKGLRRRPDGEVERRHRVIAKISRPEVARQFLAPPPEEIVQALLAGGQVSREEADCARDVPMADDLCVEADSAGHTDHGVAYAILPFIVRMRDEAMRERRYRKAVRVGGAGGIGTPEAVAATFLLGGDFVLTGSINQCTAEAGTSEAVKDMLQSAEVQDTASAPSGDMFEMGAEVQVLRKGVLFPTRANRLLELYRRHGALDEVDPPTRRQLEQKYFRCGFDEVYERCRAFLGPDSSEIRRAERDPRHQMALVFRWYLGMSTRWAIAGDGERVTDYQVHCGPALGAFNQWVRGTRLEDWRNRHADAIGAQLMGAAAELLDTRFRRLAASAKETR